MAENFWRIPGKLAVFLRYVLAIKRKRKIIEVELIRKRKIYPPKEDNLTRDDPHYNDFELVYFSSHAIKQVWNG